MLSKIFWFAILAVAALMLPSCERVIDLDLKAGASKIVIEGVITNRPDSQYVRINRSVPFQESSVYPGVTGATVTVSEKGGRVFMLRERRPGFYMSRNFVGRPGITYILKVEAEGVEYTASSTMPEPVRMDSIGVVVSQILNEEQKTVQLNYSDPSHLKNYYRFLLSINGKPSKSIFVFDDHFNNGRNVNRELFDLDLNAKSGNKAEIEMQCIDAAVHQYWKGVDQNQSRGGASTTPANPISNISNGALGYFSAHTSQREVATIP